MDTKHLPLLRQAKAGDPKALHELGYLYLFGDGVNKDYLKARRYFEMMISAEYWDIYEFEYGEILTNIGHFYFDERNFKKANEYYRMARHFIHHTYFDDFADELCVKLGLDSLIENSKIS